MTWRELPVEQFNFLKSALVIDVRSPCEHREESIPGSINVPLLSDSERAEIGTIYKQQGERVARRRALGLISPKIPALIEEIDSKRRHGQPTVIYCWRGGLRSEAVCSVLSIAGIDCFRLTGGYKAWRAGVVADFNADAYPFMPAVLVGLTGSGKTEILAALQAKGLPVLDLEALANHRGSVFGGLGLGVQPSQKDFDAALWTKLRELPRNKPVFLEGESRKIGKVALPDCVFRRIEKGTHILVTATVQRRAERIAADYLHPARNPEKELSRALDLLHHITERLGSRRVAYLKELLGKTGQRCGQTASPEILEAVSILLVEYYDPLYQRQIDRCAPYALEVDGDNVPSAVELLVQWTEQKELPPDKRGEGLVVVD